MPSFLRDLAEIKMPQVVLGVAIEFMLITFSLNHRFLLASAYRSPHQYKQRVQIKRFLQDAVDSHVSSLLERFLISTEGND